VFENKQYTVGIVILLYIFTKLIGEAQLLCPVFGQNADDLTVTVVSVSVTRVYNIRDNFPRILRCMLNSQSHVYVPHKMSVSKFTIILYRLLIYPHIPTV